MPIEMIKKMAAGHCDLPENYDIDTYTVFQGMPTRVLNDGDIIDIGGRRIKVLHTPGHGSLTVQERKNRYRPHKACIFLSNFPFFYCVMLRDVL